MTKEDQLPIEAMSLEQLIPAIESALEAFTKNFKAESAAGKARARKASNTLTKLTKQYRKVTVSK